MLKNQLIIREAVKKNEQEEKIQHVLHNINIT